MVYNTQSRSLYCIQLSVTITLSRPNAEQVSLSNLTVLFGVIDLVMEISGHLMIIINFTDLDQMVHIQLP